LKRIAAGILILMFVLLSVPVTAVAAEPPKQAFIDYYSDYLIQSFNLQQQVMGAMAENTVQLRTDASVAECQVVLDDGTTMSNIPANASLSLDFSLAQEKASCAFQGQLFENAVEGQVYFRGGEIIVPRETIQSLSDAGLDFSELGDLSQLPQYVVYPLGLSAQEQAAFNTALNQSFNYQEEQLQSMTELLVEILQIIPDGCYYYEQKYAVLDLTRIARDPGQLLNNLKSHSESLSDKFIGTLMSPPELQNDPQFQSQIAQIKTEMVAAINNLTMADLKKFQQEIPFTLKKGKLHASRDRFKTSLEVAGTIADHAMVLAMNSDARLLGDTMTSAEEYKLSVQAADYDLDINLSAYSRLNPNQAGCNMTLSGQFQEGEQPDEVAAINSLSGTVNLDLVLDWSGKGIIKTPVPNAQNSIRVEADNNQSIQVYLDGQKISVYGAEPLVYNGRTLMPVSVLTAALGGSTEWQPPDTIVLSNGSEEQLVMRLDSTSYKIGAREYTMEAPPVLRDGRTYVPVRVTAEYFGLSVIWDASSRSVYLERQ
jgi:hypothetical protein